MTKTLNEAENKMLISLYLSEAVGNFHCPNDKFFKINRGVLKDKPNSTQLNGLWQMALNAKNIDEILKEIINKVSKATLPEWRIQVVNTMKVGNEEIELWKFLAKSLIHVRDDDSDFLNDWFELDINTINKVLEDNDCSKLTEIKFLDQQRLELARSFIHRFVTMIIVERINREG
ncbi:MAG: hypothetical protein K8R40_12500 [Anaerolineaceae bacterium]|nr:hypothetical protein [Anaerolineaceae bacterium]